MCFTTIVLSNFKIFASTAVFKFQIKAESKDIQHRLFGAAVQLAKLWLSD